MYKVKPKHKRDSKQAKTIEAIVNTKELIDQGKRLAEIAYKIHEMKLLYGVTIEWKIVEVISK